MPPDTTSEFDRQLRELEAELKKLEVEYNLFFAGRLPKLPWETRVAGRGDDEAATTGMQIQNTAERFRFQGLQARFSSFCELWERTLKSREGSRPGRARPTVRRRAAAGRLQNGRASAGARGAAAVGRRGRC